MPTLREQTLAKLAEQKQTLASSPVTEPALQQLHVTNSVTANVPVTPPPLSVTASVTPSTLSVTRKHRSDKKYASNADRQRAYRERKRQS
jgi:hypothetical protein